jgi:AcrR family transcriptional regulator
LILANEESEVIKPLVLCLLDPEESPIPEPQFIKALEAVESWMVRRMLVRATTKSYSQVVAELDAPDLRAQVEQQTPAPQGLVHPAATRSLWFDAAEPDEQVRRTLTRERVVAAALLLIAEEGVEALTMRTLGARLGVVPGALYRHVRSKEQLQDLIVDGVLGEVDCDIDHTLPWTEQIKLLAHRLRTVLEDHPGVAGLLKTRDPLGPHSLALAEAVLLPLRAAGFPHRDAGLAFFLIVDYTIGFEVSNPRISINEQRVRDAATRRRLHEFFRSLPGDRFPTLIALGEHVWLDNRDERFAAGINVLVDGLEQTQRPTSPPS